MHVNVAEWQAGSHDCGRVAGSWYTVVIDWRMVQEKKNKRCGSLSWCGPEMHFQMSRTPPRRNVAKTTGTLAPRSSSRSTFHSTPLNSAIYLPTRLIHPDLLSASEVEPFRPRTYPTAHQLSPEHVGKTATGRPARRLQVRAVQACPAWYVTMFCCSQ